MRFNRLLDFLSKNSHGRQQIISAAEANSFADYNTRFYEQALPTIVVMIDNFAEMAVQIREENFDTLFREQIYTPGT